MKEVILLSTFLLIVPLFFGSSFLYALHGPLLRKGLCFRDGYLIGGIICIGLAEAAHLYGGMSGWSFSGFIKVYGLLLAGFGALCILAAAARWCLRKKADASFGKTPKETKKEVFTSAEFLMLICLMLMAGAYLARLLLMSDFSMYKDITPETVSSMLDTDQFLDVNPMTGKPYETGAPSRYRILCLPALYGAICRISGLGVAELCYRWIPVFVFLLSLAAFSLVAKSLWQESRQSRMLFMIVILALYYLTDAGEGQTGFMLLHQGFSPQTIRLAVLLPYTLRLCIDRNYVLVLLPILAEACIVWTWFGTGWCFLLALMWLAASFVRSVYRKRKGERV